MKRPAVLYVLLVVVAGCAAVLSFAALRDLALVCGFSPRLAWLLPVTVDAGAAAGSLVWLGGFATGVTRRFARALALALLGLSVVANALGHGLAAYALAPPWWVVVVVSAIAPAVLGAVVHLAVLVGRPATDGAGTGEQERTDQAVEHADVPDEPMPMDLPAAVAAPGRVAELIADGAGRRRLSRELEITEHEARKLLDGAARNGHAPAEVAR